MSEETHTPSNNFKHILFGDQYATLQKTNNIKNNGNLINRVILDSE